MGGWLGDLTVIIRLVSIQLAFDLPTGTELGNKFDINLPTRTELDKICS